MLSKDLERILRQIQCKLCQPKAFLTLMKQLKCILNAFPTSSVIYQWSDETLLKSIFLSVKNDHLLQALDNELLNKMNPEMHGYTDAFITYDEYPTIINFDHEIEQNYNLLNKCLFSIRLLLDLPQLQWKFVKDEQYLIEVKKKFLAEKCCKNFSIPNNWKVIQQLTVYFSKQILKNIQ